MWDYFLGGGRGICPSGAGGVTSTWCRDGDGHTVYHGAGEGTHKNVCCGTGSHVVLGTGKRVVLVDPCGEGGEWVIWCSGGEEVWVYSAAWEC